MIEAFRRRVQRLRVRRFRRLLGKRKAIRQGRANRTLSQVEASPDPLPRAVAALAVCVAEGGRNGPGDGLDKEPPQDPGCQAQASDFVGEPDAEGAPATAPSIAVAAKDPSRAGHFLLAGLIEPAQPTMPNEHADRVTMGARFQREITGDLDPILLVAVKPMNLAHLAISPKKSANSTSQKNAGERGTIKT